MYTAGYSCSAGTFEELFTKVDSDNDGCAAQLNLAFLRHRPHNLLHSLPLTVGCVRGRNTPGASHYRSGLSRTRTSSVPVCKARRCGRRQSSKLSATVSKAHSKNRYSRPRQRGTGRTLAGKLRLPRHIIMLPVIQAILIRGVLQLDGKSPSYGSTVLGPVRSSVPSSCRPHNPRSG